MPVGRAGVRRKDSAATSRRRGRVPRWSCVARSGAALRRGGLLRGGTWIESRWRPREESWESRVITQLQRTEPRGRKARLPDEPEGKGPEEGDETQKAYRFSPIA